MSEKSYAFTFGSKKQNVKLNETQAMEDNTKFIDAIKTLTKEIETLKNEIKTIKEENIKKEKQITNIKRELDSIKNVVKIKKDCIDFCNQNNDTVLRVSERGVECAGLHIHNDNEDETESDEILTVEGTITCKKLVQD